jgi:integrase
MVTRASNSFPDREQQPMQHELTDALIRTLRAPAGGRLELWDKRCEGLVLRVSATGRVTWHARARGPDGRKRFANLGLWPALSLSDARTEARLKVGLMQKGADPTKERNAAREEQERAAAMPTLRELGKAWAKAHARDTGVRYRDELLAAVGRGCGDPIRRADHPDAACAPDLMGRRVHTVTVDNVAAAVQASRARGDGEARHLVRALRRLFGFAVAVGHIQINPVDVWLRREKGGRRSIPWMRDGIRERVLTDRELVKLWDASASLDASARVFTRLLLLTACRCGEITGLSWREIELDTDATGKAAFKALVLPPTRTKNRRGHRVPLGSLAADELQSLVKDDNQGRPSGLIFSGIASRTASTCRALRKGVGIDDWTWHDIRRTAATGMARLGCPREHVEAALNHISARGGLVGIYQRHTFDTEAAAALLRWQHHVAELVGRALGAVVVKHPAAA